ncbi:MAG: putative ABC transporter permease subunit [Betaproteobacteria bacterium]
MFLLTPRCHAVKNRLTRLAPGDGFKASVLAFLGLAFWALIFGVSYRVLSYFRTIEGLGDLLALRLLSMILLTFFSILIFSNIVTSLSTYYLSGELEILLSSPVRIESIFRTKFTETLIDSSWMTLIYGLPVFIAYGTAFKASPGYYLGLVLTIIPFVLIPAAIGIIITMLLVNAFPARRAKDIIVLLGLLFFVVIYILFRMLQPEKLVDPDTFPSLVQYLTAMRAPMSPLLPSSWATEILSPLLRKTHGESVFFLLLLWSTGLAGIVIGEWVCLKIYYAGWSRSQEGKKAPISRSQAADLFFSFITMPFRGKMRAVVLKDLKLFFRDTSQWSQLFLIVALMIVYIYSFRLLPIERAAMPSFFLQNLISFLNLGMVGFVTSAVAVRFVFPAVSLEGASFWIIRSSPLSIKSFLLAKFWSSLLPLLVLSEMLIIVSNILLKVTSFMMILGVITVFMMTFGIAALGVGLGSIFPKFKHENVAQIPTGFGGIVYMLLTMLFIGVVITFEAWPVYKIFMAQTVGSRITTGGWILITGSAALVVTVNILALILPIKIGISRLLDREI